MLNLLQVNYSLATKIQSVADAAKRLQISKTELDIMQRLYGLHRLPFDESEIVSTYLLAAAQQCIQQAQVEVGAIKWLLHAHTANPVAPFGISPVRQVQAKLQLWQAQCFGTSMSKCASIFIALQLAEALFANLNREDAILILAGDVSFTRILQYIPGTTFTSEGACAILVSKNHEQHRILQIAVHTYGEFAQGIWANQTLTQQFEKLYCTYLAAVIQEVLDHAQLSIAHIKLILPHNVNTFSWYQVLKILGANTTQIYLDNIARTGHCFGADPFINFKDAQAGGLFVSGDYIIMATVGLGASFAAMLLQV